VVQQLQCIFVLCVSRVATNYQKLFVIVKTTIDVAKRALAATQNTSKLTALFSSKLAVFNIVAELKAVTQSCITI